MKCYYCGKQIKGEGVSIYADGKLVSAFCKSDCMGKAYKKMSRLIKKMSREELIDFIEKNKGVTP